MKTLLMSVLCIVAFIGLLALVHCGGYSIGFIRGRIAGLHEGIEIGHQQAVSNADLSAPTTEEEFARQRLLYHPEERIGGGYRNGKFVRLKDVAR